MFHCRKEELAWERAQQIVAWWMSKEHQAARSRQRRWEAYRSERKERLLRRRRFHLFMAAEAASMLSFVLIIAVAVTFMGVQIGNPTIFSWGALVSTVIAIAFRERRFLRVGFRFWCNGYQEPNRT